MEQQQPPNIIRVLGTLCYVAIAFQLAAIRPPLVERAGRYFNQHARLKLNDCFALALAEELGDSLLLTGDGPLRRVAEDNGIEVHGVLWVTDEMETHAIVPFTALQLFAADDLVFLPQDEGLRRIRRLAPVVTSCHPASLEANRQVDPAPPVAGTAEPATSRGRRGHDSEI